MENIEHNKMGMFFGQNKSKEVSSTLDDGLVFAYNFNETSGTVLNDDSSNGLDGTSDVTSINQTGNPDKSYLFVSANHYKVTIADDDLLSVQVSKSGFTMSFWYV